MKTFWMRGRAVYDKHREKVVYLFFGGLTTLVYYLVYFLFSRLLLQSTSLSTNAGYIVSVLFAFAANKLWVFKSREKKAGGVLWELGAFIAARLLSWLLNLGIMVLCVDVWRLWDVPVLLFANVLVIVLNYFASKLFIFKKKKLIQRGSCLMENKTIYDLLHRRSCRAFKPALPTKEELDTILQCAVYAPSAMNAQPWHFTMIRKKELLDEMSAAMADIMKSSGDEKAVQRASVPGFSSFHNAPCAVMISGPEDARFRVSDCGGAAVNITVAAQALGVGSVIVASVLPAFHGPYAAELLKQLQLPDGYVPTLMVALGYPVREETAAPERKDGVITFID